MKLFPYVFSQIFFFFWLRRVFVAAHGLSLVAASRGYCSLLCVGFSLWWLLLLRSTGSRRTGFSSCAWASVVVVHGLSCSVACGIFLDQGLNLCPHLHWQVDSQPLCHQGSPVLALMFRSLIHFKLIFCIWCKVRVQLHSFACEYSVFLAPFAEKICNTLQISMSYLCRGHANLLYIIPVLVYVLPKWALDVFQN